MESIYPKMMSFQLFQLRVMVGLPAVENREKIVRTLLAKEKVEGLDFKELALMTEGYSGSDIKNLCVTAAYRPVRELIQRETKKEKAKMQKNKDGQSAEDAAAPKDETQEEKEIFIKARKHGRYETGKESGSVGMSTSQMSQPSRTSANEEEITSQTQSRKRKISVVWSHFTRVKGTTQVLEQVWF